MKEIIRIKLKKTDFFLKHGGLVKIKEVTNEAEKKKITIRVDLNDITDQYVTMDVAIEDVRKGGGKV